MPPDRPASNDAKTPHRPAQPYHHGNLRPVLLQAAEAELVAHGIEGFSLRGVAKRAAVSHAAPAHHFRDANGLLTALAAEGFKRFVVVQAGQQQRAAADGLSQLVAAGLGYIAFARAHPALFRLMFASDRLDRNDRDLCVAGNGAFGKLQEDVARARSEAGGDGIAPELDEAAVWALAHGMADLLISGRLRQLAQLPEDEMTAALTLILRRAFAQSCTQT